MKPTAVLFAVLFLCVGLSTVSAKAPGNESVSWGRAVNGVQAGLSLDGAQTEFLPGEHVALKLFLRNVGKKPVAFAAAEGYYDANDQFNWSIVTKEEKHNIYITRGLGPTGRPPRPLTISLLPSESQPLTGPSLKFLLAIMGNSAYTEPVAFIETGSYSIQVAPLMPYLNGRDNWARKLVTGAASFKVQAAQGSSSLPGKSQL